VVVLALRKIRRTARILGTPAAQFRWLASRVLGEPHEETIMGSRSDFWLTLHQLANNLLKEGATDVERGKNICLVFHTLSPATRNVYLENLHSVISALDEVEKQCNEQL